MKPNTNDLRTLFQLDYGSKLYGTNTPTSDTDRKVIYIPGLDHVMLGYKQDIFKLRYDADGNKVGVNDTMPDNGVETEYIPLATFARDFVRGQTYAVELAYGYAQKGVPGEAMDFVTGLMQFKNSDVYSMTGFAAKQTLDYVQRGDRMLKAQTILAVLRDIEAAHSVYLAPGSTGSLRLDSVWNSPSDHTGLPDHVLDVVARRTGLPIGSAENNNKMNRTLELNGRSYLETTRLDHLIGLLEKKIKEYGSRTVEASGKGVDWKSLSHAVRVYRQAIELCETGNVAFPRPDREELLRIKKGEVPMEDIKAMLIDLDLAVKKAIEDSKLPTRNDELEAAADFWLLAQLHRVYNLS